MYLGHPGWMVEIKCPTTQRNTASERYAFATTLGGKVKAQAAPTTRRTWDISLGQLATPADVGTLTEFANGTWGSGPFTFISADAPVVNMFTPGAAACDLQLVRVTSGGAITGSGPIDLGDDGLASNGVHKTQDGTLIFTERVPVIPGRPVTGSAWVRGIGGIRLEFIDVHGAVVHAREAFQGPGRIGRIAVTGIAPDDVATVELHITPGITHIARPAITLTDQMYEWGDGQGCQKAIVHNTNRDLIKAWDDPRTGRWSNLNFTIQEVG